MAYEQIIYEVADNSQRPITLNRPEKPERVHRNHDETSDRLDDVRPGPTADDHRCAR